jgi:phage terminase large subunit-like protein
VTRRRNHRGTPAQWATAAIAAYRRHQADRIVGEVNNSASAISWSIASNFNALPELRAGDVVDRVQGMSSD